MRDIKNKLQNYYNNLTKIFDTNNDSPKLLHRQTFSKNQKNEELLTGIIIVFLIITILLSLGYYFLVFSPQQEDFNNLKQEKINRVNSLLSDDENHNKEAIISEIERCNSIESLETFDVDAMVYPILKNSLLEQLKEYKDRYNRVEVHTNNSTDIMNINNATSFIESRNSSTLSSISIEAVDSVIIPLSINRKQAASGLITEGNSVDIYKTGSNAQVESESLEENQSQEDNIITSRTTKIVGGSQIVSILRSKDSAVIEQNLEMSEYPKSRNISQLSSLDIQQILSSKAAGTYDEQQIKILLDDYGTRLSNYERTSRIGELDVEYIIMLEVPRDSVEYLIDNMDNIILTIPTYDAPSWVKL
jgi:hypothetical protein